MWSSKLLFAFEGRLNCMAYDIKNTLAVNLQHLMEQSSDMKSQKALGKRAKVGQTTIGANCLSEKDIATYQKVRRAFES